MAQARLRGVRPALYAGTWYPGTPETLRQAVDHYLGQARVGPLPGGLVALVAPHAGYIYSGPVAGYAYKALQEAGQSFDTVVLIGPSHRAYLDGYGITSVEAYETPLGQVPLDADLVTTLGRELGMLRFLSRDEEHSLEIQLPFLQRVLGNFRLVPLMMGDQSWEACQELGQVLGQALKDRSALLVASTDLSHYHEYGRAVALDRLVLERVEAFDPQGLVRILERGKAEACGGGPLAATMLAAKALGADTAAVLHYANSGDVTGDRSHVVGYMAAALCRGKGTAG